MSYTRETVVDSNPGGDSVKQACLDLDTDLSNIFDHLNTHEAATTGAGIHGMGASTICGTDLTQTLTNKTFTIPTINSPSITGGTIFNPTITGTGTLAGVMTASGLTLNSPTISSPTITNATLQVPIIVVGSDADGDIWYRSSGKVTRLPKGSAYQELQMNSGATAPAWAASPASLFTAAGDILYASAINTPARLAKGSAYQGLIMDSGGNFPSWGASMQSLLTAQADIIYASAAYTPARLAKGSAYQHLGLNAGNTAPEWQSSLQSLMTAQGDLVYASSANTPAKLAKGTAYQTLRMNSGATAPEWASPLKSPTLVSFWMTSDHYIQGMDTSYTTKTSIKVYIPLGATYCRFSVYMQSAGSTGYIRLNISSSNSDGVSVASGVWQWKDVGNAFDISSFAGSLVTLNVQMYNNVGDPQTVDLQRLIVYLCTS